MRFFRRILVLSFLVIVAVLAINIYLPKEQLIENIPSQKISTEKNISFAVISDIHSDFQNLQKVLDKIKNDKMDFVIIAGDLTTVGAASEFKKVKDLLDKSGLKYYVIPGNHDYYKKTAITNPFLDVFSLSYESFQINQTKFILIDNAGDVDQVQSNWIDGQIADCPKLYCLVFSHMPLNHEYLLHIMGEDNPKIALEAKSLVKKLVDFKIKKLYAGHIHYLSDYIFEGLETYTDGAIYTNKNQSPSRFLEVTVSQPDFKLAEQEVWIE
jgi:predicted MPP superfamily phosphohydrolase